MYLLEKGTGWTATEITGGNLHELPPLDSHAMVYVNSFLYVFGGFEGKPKFEASNRLLCIDIQKRWFYDVGVTDRVPRPRLNFGYCLDASDRLVVFGGSNKNVKYSDVLRFDFVTKEWSLVANEILEKVPIT